jgi:hypothetical protein
MKHWGYLDKIRKYLPLEAQYSRNCGLPEHRCHSVSAAVIRNDLSAVDIANTATRYPREARPMGLQENMLILEATIYRFIIN